MTTLEMVAVAGFAGTIIVNALVVGITYGSIATRLSAVEKSIERDGGQGFVREERIDLLHAQAQGEHLVMNSEINTLRERVHGHERVLADHGARLDSLETR